MIRLGRRRRPRVHIIKQDMARRAVRDASGSAGREHSLTPMLVLTRPRPGGHHERYPLAAKSNGPPLTRKATLEIYTVARSSQDLPPGCFTTPPGGGFGRPRVQNTPRGVCKHPRGWFRTPLRVRTTPGCTWRTARGWIAVRTLGSRCPRRGRCGVRPPARPAAASCADTTTAQSRP